MTRCLLGIGSNLGDRREMLRRATGCVARLDGCQLLAQSDWHETVPIGGPAGQGAFLNGAVLLDCAVRAEHLVGALQSIESQLGRDRAIRWDARAIDLDLLLFGREVIESPGLSVPHPRMSFRRFVLEPAAEIAGFMVDPISSWTLARLLRHLKEAPRYVAVTSSEAKIADWLASELCQEFRGPRLEEASLVAEEAGDSEVPPTVEFDDWATTRLRSDCWANDPELAKRLGSTCGKLRESVSPVVSSFWCDVLAAGRSFQVENTPVPLPGGESDEKNLSAAVSIVSPALVIEVEPCSKENFWKKMETKKRKKSQSNFPNFPQTPSSGFPESRTHGPTARLRAEDPAMVLQEAVAAVRSVWPELPEKSLE